MRRVCVLVSGGGTNLQAILDAAGRGELPHAHIALVVSSRPGVKALERVEAADVETRVVERKAFPDIESYDDALLALLLEKEIDLLVTAGFMTILGSGVLKTYERRIVNVHPSLIPSFCGDGMYGLRVHEAALEYGVKVTGATVHLVNEITDGGEILLQKAVDVQEGDTPESLQLRVMEQAEWVLLPRAVEMLCRRMDEGNPF